MSEALEGWTEFNVAMVGATAALAGLLIVAMSVNIAEIMKAPTLPARAAAAIAALTLAIVAGAFGLMPGQTIEAYGIEVLVATIIVAGFQVHAIRVIATKDTVSTFDRVAKGTAGVLPIVAFLTGGLLIVTGSAPAGLLAVAVGSVLAVVAALIMAWIVLVEVLR
jgi:hypothetical protein